MSHPDAAADGPDVQRVGPYRILEILGEGGMGTVYLAEQKEPIRRRVAVKLIKLGMDTKQVLARFEAERQALAMMEHDCIAKVLEAGATEDGRPYFVMEYVKGSPLTAYCDQQKLGLPERLDLFRQVCSGIQHAHQKGIIHRDLKPSNVLVTVQGGRPVPKIIDFGLARATGQQLVDQTIFTVQGEVIGTPEYMSPEQAGLGDLDIDTRSDIYSLGVLLYELLTSQLPFADLRQRGLLEMQRIIREEEPARPSTRISGLHGENEPPAIRGLDTGGLARRLRGDLDWITMMALEKDRTRRYETAAQMSEDLRRYLDHEPVVASPPSTAYRLRKLVRKHRVPIATCAGIALALVAGLVVSLLLKTQSDRNAALAKVRETHARRHAYVSSIRAAAAAYRLNEPANMRRSLLSAPEEFRNWEWKHLNALRDTSLWASQGPSDATAIAFSPDGSQILRGNLDGTAHLLDARTGTELALLRGSVSEPRNRVLDASFSADGSRILITGDYTVWIWDATNRTELAAIRGVGFFQAVLSPDNSRLIVLPWPTSSASTPARLWDARTGAPLGVLEHDGTVLSAAFSPDSSRIVTGSRDKTARVWNAKTGTETRVLRGHVGGVWAAAFSPDGARIATGAGGGYRDQTVRLWDAFSGTELLVLQGLWCDKLAFSPDGRLLVAVAPNRGRRDKPSTAHLWDVATGKKLGVLQGHEGGITAVTFSPDGARLATSSTDKTARLWDTASGAEVATLRGHETELTAVAFSPDGSRVAAAGGESVRLWSSDTGTGVTSLKAVGAVEPAAAFSPDGSLIASGTLSNGDLSGTRDNEAHVWDSRGREITVLRGHEGPIASVCFSPDGGRVATASLDGTVRLWHAATGVGIATLRHQSGARGSLRAIWSSNGSRVVTTKAFTAGHLWDVTTGAEPTLLRGDEKDVTSAAFAPDRSRVVTGCKDNAARLWDASTGAELAVLRGHDGEVSSVAFSPDGSRIATGSDDKTVRLWDASTGKELAVLRGHASGVRFVAFSPKGSRLLSMTWDAVHTWRVEGGVQQLAVLRGHDSRVAAAAYSPDGSRIVTAAADGMARVWDPQSGEQLVVLRGAVTAEFSPDGLRILTGSNDGAVYLYDSVPWSARHRER